MPKKYCPHCGYANEHSGATPEKCKECKKPLKISVLTKPVIVSPNQKITASDFEEGENFDSLMDNPPEPLSQTEIFAQFLPQGGNQGLKLVDLIKKEPIETPKAKRRARVKKGK
jgi:hypothetical protein